jgi:hypothetical protein
MRRISSILTGAIDIRQARTKALQAAEQNAYVGVAAGDERVTEARAALMDAAGTLRSVSRGHSRLVRLYCRLFRYDLEAAASALIRLHHMTGYHGYSNEARKLVLDDIYVFLGARGQITAQVERERRLEQAKF